MENNENKTENKAATIFKKILLWLLFIAMAAGLIFLGYLYYEKDEEDGKKVELEKRIEELEEKNQELNNKLEKNNLKFQETENELKKATDSNKEFTIYDEWNVNDEWKLKINKVIDTEVIDSKEEEYDAQTEDKELVLIYYTYENINLDKDLLIKPTKVLNENAIAGKEVDFPVEDQINLPKKIKKGEKSEEVTTLYLLEDDADFVHIEFEQEDNNGQTHKVRYKVNVR